MRPRILAAYFALGLWTVVLGVGALYVLLHRSEHRRLHCVPWVLGPSPVLACDNGHAYLRQGDVLVDLGTRSPRPGTLPRR